jgi:hypothetical protein
VDTPFSRFTRPGGSASETPRTLTLSSLGHLHPQRGVPCLPSECGQRGLRSRGLADDPRLVVGVALDDAPKSSWERDALSALRSCASPPRRYRWRTSKVVIRLDLPLRQRLALALGGAGGRRRSLPRVGSNVNNLMACPGRTLARTWGLRLGLDLGRLEREVVGAVGLLDTELGAAAGVGWNLERLALGCWGEGKLMSAASARGTHLYASRRGRASPPPCRSC